MPWPPCRVVQPEVPLSLLKPPLHHQQTSLAVMVMARPASVLPSWRLSEKSSREKTKKKEVTSLDVQHVIRRCLCINFILHLTIRVLQLSLHIKRFYLFFKLEQALSLPWLGRPILIPRATASLPWLWRPGRSAGVGEEAWAGTTAPLAELPCMEARALGRPSLQLWLAAPAPAPKVCLPNRFLLNNFRRGWRGEGGWEGGEL